MKVWISSPNGVTDSSAVNDTVYRTISAGLTGTYTLGGKSPDFPNFRSAVNALNKFGVCGPLVINVRDTSYNESVLLKSIPGSSAVNTVTFQSQSGDSTKVILDTAYASPYYFPHAAYVLRFDGTQYVTFRKMSITNTEMTVSSSNVVSMVDGANHITLENNLIYCPSGMNTGAVILTEPNTSESNITIRNNSIWGGAYGIYFAGNISILGPFEHSNVIEGNKVDTISSVGLYLQFQDSMQILANNIIVDGGYAVGIYAYDFTSTNKCNMINNFITAGGSSTYGLYSEQVLSMNMHYNSIATTGACLYTVYISASGGAKTSVMNNIMWSSSGEAYGGDPNGISSSDYNDIYANGWSLLISWMGTYSTVSAFSAATGMDKHSISVNANFVDVTNGDLHLTDSSGVRKKAKVISAITTDFDGQKRNATKPDIGADEFIHDSFDVGATAIVSPSNASCGNISSTIGVKIANFGLQAQSGFKVHVIINGKDSATTTFTGTLKGTSGGVPHDTIVNISFAKPWNTIGGGLYSIKAYTMLPNDSNHANDTITVKDSFYALPMLKFGYTRACLNDTAHFLDSSTSAASITSRTWNFGNSTKGSGAIGKTMYKSVGKYDVQLKVKDAHGCMDSLTRTVSIDSVNADFKFKYTGLVVDFTANNSKLKSYSWDFGDKSKAGTSYNPSHTYPAYNSYNVTLTTTNADGCIAIWSDSVRIFVTGIEGQTSGNAFSIYPNPAKDRLYITSPLTPLPRRGEQARAIITDISGKVLADQEIHSNESMINISTLPAGVYLLRYQDKDRVEVLKFVKE